MARLTQFLGQILRFLVILIALASVLFTIQTIWHTFDPLIDFVNQDVLAVNATLSAQWIAGISISTLVLFVILLLIPIMIRGVNNRQFFPSFLRGILSSAVFLVSDYLYTQFESLGRFYLVLAILVSITITIVMTEIITRAGKQKDEVSVRSDIMASITSGLAFGIILKIGTYGWNYLQSILKFT